MLFVCRSVRITEIGDLGHIFTQGGVGNLGSVLKHGLDLDLGQGFRKGLSQDLKLRLLSLIQTKSVVSDLKGF